MSKPETPETRTFEPKEAPYPDEEIRHGGGLGSTETKSVPGPTEGNEGADERRKGGVKKP